FRGGPRLSGWLLVALVRRPELGRPRLRACVYLPDRLLEQVERVHAEDERELEADPVLLDEVLEQTGRALRERNVDPTARRLDWPRLVPGVELEAAPDLRHEHERPTLDEPVQAALAQLVPLGHRGRPGLAAGANWAPGTGRRASPERPADRRTRSGRARPKRAWAGRARCRGRTLAGLALPVERVVRRRPRPDLTPFPLRVFALGRPEAGRFGENLRPRLLVGLDLHRGDRRPGHPQQLAQHPLDVSGVRLLARPAEVADRDPAVDAAVPLEEPLDRFLATLAAGQPQQLTAADGVGEALPLRLALGVIERAADRLAEHVDVARAGEPEVVSGGVHLPCSEDREFSSALLGRLSDVLPPVEAQQGRLVVEHGLQVNRSAPDLVDVTQDPLGVADVDLASLVDVAQVQLARLPVVPVLHLDVRHAKVRHAADDYLADLLRVLLDDDRLVVLHLVDVEIELLDELVGQVVPQERDVALELPHLEDLRAALAPLPAKAFALLVRGVVPASLDILEDLQADVVRVHVVLRRRHHPRVHPRELDVLVVAQLQLADDARMPVRRPALVHDFGLHLRDEVEHLVPHDLDDVTLPVLQIRRVLDEEQEEILLRPLRDAARLRRMRRGTLVRGQQVVVLARLRLRRLAALLPRMAKPLVRVDVLLDRQDGVEELLDLPAPVLELVAADAIGAGRGALDHAAV